MRLIDADELKTCFQWSEKARLSVTEITKIIDNAPTVSVDEEIERQREELYQSSKKLFDTARMLGVARSQGKWFDCITKGTLKARHGDYVLYKVDYLLDHLTREVYIMEGARKMRGKNK